MRACTLFWSWPGYRTASASRLHVSSSRAPSCPAQAPPRTLTRFIFQVIIAKALWYETALASYSEGKSVTKIKYEKTIHTKENV